MTPENQAKLEALREQHGTIKGGELRDGTLVAVMAPPRGAWKQAVDEISKERGDTDGAQFKLVCASLVAPSTSDGKPDLGTFKQCVEAYPGITQSLFEACSQLAGGGLDFEGN